MKALALTLILFSSSTFANSAALVEFDRVCNAIALETGRDALDISPTQNLSEFGGPANFIADLIAKGYWRLGYRKLDARSLYFQLRTQCEQNYTVDCATRAVKATANY